MILNEFLKLAYHTQYVVIYKDDEVITVGYGREIEDQSYLEDELDYFYADQEGISIHIY